MQALESKPKISHKFWNKGISKGFSVRRNSLCRFSNAHHLWILEFQDDASDEDPDDDSADPKQNGMKTNSEDYLWEIKGFGSLEASHWWNHSIIKSESKYTLDVCGIFASRTAHPEFIKLFIVLDNVVVLGEKKIF